MKQILILVFIVVLATDLSAQNGIARNANASLFSGYLLKKQNTNSNAYWYGVYVDAPFAKSEKYNFGIFGLYSASEFQDNIAQYKSTTSEMAAGLNAGIYLSSGMSSLNSFYGGVAVGYKRAREIGTVNKRRYSSEGTQSDNMAIANINLNLFREMPFLPRTQLIMSLQKPFSSEKLLSENSGTDKIVSSWRKGYYDITFKQSLWEFPVSRSAELLAQPKLGFSYDHYEAGFPNSFSLIGEISLKKLFSDDFLSLTCQYKTYPGKETDYIVYGVTVNVLRLLEKK